MLANVCWSHPTREFFNKLLEGKAFLDLSLKFQERIEDTLLTLYILDSKAPERAKLDIFERVNSGGSPLTRQQMRHCLHTGQATAWLRDAAQGPFVIATGGALDSKTMRDREAINRFCAFYLLGWETYKGDMDGFLADVLNQMNTMSHSQLNDLRQRFDGAMAVNFELFRVHAFRKSLAGPPNGKRSVLNIALFDVCSVLFAQIDVDELRRHRKAVKEAVGRMIGDEEFSHSITYSTNSRKRVANRFQWLAVELRAVIA